MRSPDRPVPSPTRVRVSPLTQARGGGRRAAALRATYTVVIERDDDSFEEVRLRAGAAIDAIAWVIADLTREGADGVLAVSWEDLVFEPGPAWERLADVRAGLGGAVGHVARARPVDGQGAPAA